VDVLVPSIALEVFLLWLSGLTSFTTVHSLLTYAKKKGKMDSRRNSEENTVRELFIAKNI
jgi:hypothetical protein